MYDFFTLYADVDSWNWDGSSNDPSHELTNPLDQWIISRVHQLTQHVDKHMQAYDIPNALADILPFIDDASNWYVRRSRKRFWKSDNDKDKDDAYKTMHYFLVRLSMVMAPFTPFLAEELYRKLTGGESVHLLDWPEAGNVDTKLIEEMMILRKLITGGLEMRSSDGIKVRQPLSAARLEWSQEFKPGLLDIAKEELNVKRVDFGLIAEGNYQITIDKKITPELKKEGLVREVVRQVQSARKAAGLQVDDRIALVLFTTEKEVAEAINEHADILKHETLATNLLAEGDGDYQTTVMIESSELVVKLSKA